MSIRNKLSLFELSKKIKAALDNSFPFSEWVVAEISELKENRAGHCYLELAEKDEDSSKPKAKARAIIWSWTYRMIKPFFETSTNRALSEGMKVLVNCDVTYHPVYGLSLNIKDIDPTFTIGDIEQQKQHTINALIADGVYEMNKALHLPILPKKIAIISSPTAAGYQDFVHQIDKNTEGYSVEHELFPAIMQGDRGEESIIEALDMVYESPKAWDIVVIIRGGGSQIDLGCFDGYFLASHIAQFPIPIVTGIGHEKDVSVSDLVAHTSLKTPTAVAEFIIEIFNEAENWLLDCKDKFRAGVERLIASNNQSISQILHRFAPLIARSTNKERMMLQRTALIGQEAIRKNISAKLNITDFYMQNVKGAAQNLVRRKEETAKQYDKWLTIQPVKQINQKASKLSYLEKTANALNPLEVLKRGFSITRVKGKAIKSYSEVSTNDILETTLAEGKVISHVKNIK
ncbi:MAG: exodeoxyribonuclease VII large subunit [Bacteroidales bacterium]